MPNYSPYVRVLNSDRETLPLQVRSARYVYSEDLEDRSRITIESDDASYVDHVDIQEDQPLYLVWGYLGDKNSKSERKVYIIDSTANFTETGVVITLECLPKASYLKWNSKNVVRNDTSLGDAAKEMADRIGLNYNDEVTSTSGGLEVLQTGFSKPSERIEEVYNNPDDPTDPRNGEIIERGVTAASDSARVRLTYAWRRYGSLPQGNKSDADVLNALKQNEPLDNLVVSGRDDDLTIKKRNFSQAPVRSVIWKGGNGHLLKFKSGIKNTFNKSRSILTSADGWDPASKTYIKGDVKNTLDGNELLGDNLPVNLEEILNQEVAGYPNNERFYGLYQEYETTDEEGNKVSSFIKNDELNGQQKFIYRERKGATPRVFTKDGYILETDVTSRIPSVGYLPVRFGKHSASIEQDATNIAGSAIPDRAEKTKELTSTSATLLGDALLIEGKILNVQGVGKKYGGNWYITKAEHILDPSGSGWLVELELTKNARGKVDEPLLYMQTAGQLNKSVNTQSQAEDGEFQIPNQIEY